MTIYFLSAIVAWLLGAQVALREMRLLSGHYNYKLMIPQYVTFISFAVSVLLLAYDIFNYSVSMSWLLAVCGVTLTYAVWEWILSILSPHKLFISLLLRILFIFVTTRVLCLADMKALMPFVVAGLFLRNSPFGVVHGKPLFLVSRMKRKTNDCFPETDVVKTMTEKNSRIDVTTYGINPDTSEDLIERVQNLIDEVGRRGGGVLFFPRGRYLFNKQGKKAFLQINHPHITIEGECDEDGKLLTEFFNCGNLVQGSRNPWISPFFITTGEGLQPSNMFFGLDFRNPKHIHSESSSLSDPGSDGKILTPPLATGITADAQKGATRLQVEDSSLVGKYILIGMFNTDESGSLIKELLGVQQLRPEWHTALRAGDEVAPSFQWLVEVKSVVDAHTIELCTPLLCDISMKYEPQVFNVEMLEDIHIRNILISSRWNGLFRHHGFPLYYSVAKTQEMDYGWNGINLKRAAHSSVENVVLSNFTNPLYVQDSRSVTVAYVKIKGYDGHQALKMYCHTSDSQFHDIDFYCHFADMMGGEGNAYGNTFSRIRYLNPEFKPVDYDFHGIPEGPMCPPGYNTFSQVIGFRYIKGAGAIFNMPACAAHNRWQDTVTEGEVKGEQLFYAMTYRVKSGMLRFVTAVGFSLVKMMKSKKHSPAFFYSTFRDKLADIDKVGIARTAHDQFFPYSEISGIKTTCDLSKITESTIVVKSI